jgi:hypothetical protein
MLQTPPHAVLICETVFPVHTDPFVMLHAGHALRLMLGER